MRRASGGRRLTALLEGVTQGFPHAFDAGERADRGQDVGGIRRRGAPRVAPAAGFTGDQDGIPQAPGGLMGQPPVATIVQAGASAPWVGPLKAEGLCPIETAAAGIRRLPIGEPCDRPA
jgi:hypothetical protein